MNSSLHVDTDKAQDLSTGRPFRPLLPRWGSTGLDPVPERVAMNRTPSRTAQPKEIDHMSNTTPEAARVLVHMHQLLW